MSLPGSLDTIAIDLTPVLAAGENGGAKIFALALVRNLADLAPDTGFVLLTQAASHDELATLDRPNVRRVCVVGASDGPSPRQRLKRFAIGVMPHLPGRVRRRLSRFAYGVNAFVKRGGSRSLLADLGADLLFCPFTAPTYHDPGVPTVCTIYDLQYRAFPEFFTPEEMSVRERTFVEACRRASMLAAISDWSRAEAIAHGALDPTRIRTVHLRLAARLTASDPNDDGILERLRLTRRRYLIYPANFWPHKNHEMLLVAFGIAAHAGLAADLRLVCPGSPGTRLDGLRDAALRLGLGDRVVFPGFVADVELAILLREAAAMIFPSLFEGFGLPVIEAMTGGVPVACSDRTSLPEIAGGAAIFFDPRIPTQIADAMVAIVEASSSRTSRIEAGLRRAAAFADTSRMAAEYWSLFEDAVARPATTNA